MERYHIKGVLNTSVHRTWWKGVLSYCALQVDRHLLTVLLVHMHLCCCLVEVLSNVWIHLSLCVYVGMSCGTQVSSVSVQVLCDVWYLWCFKLLLAVAVTGLQQQGICATCWRSLQPMLNKELISVRGFSWICTTAFVSCLSISWN